MARREPSRRVVARHRALWAFGLDGLVLVVVDCRWRGFVYPEWAVGGSEDVVECHRCGVAVPVPPDPAPDEWDELWDGMAAGPSPGEASG